MEDQRKAAVLPAGDAFNGVILERNVSFLSYFLPGFAYLMVFTVVISVILQVENQAPIIFKPADEPPRRVSRFKLQRMQQATE